MTESRATKTIMVSIYNKFSNFHDHQRHVSAHTWWTVQPGTEEEGSYIYVKALPRTSDMMYMGHIYIMQQA